MPNYNCEICGKSPEYHAVLFGKCYPDGNSYYTPIKYIYVPASLLDKVRELCDVADGVFIYTWQAEILKAVREALAEIDKGE